MNDDVELFATKEEALAFVKGYRLATELLEGDIIFVNDPLQLSTGEWRVDHGTLG